MRGALTNGATETEIRETLLQAAIYCGVPAAMEAFRRADAVLSSLSGDGAVRDVTERPRRACARSGRGASAPGTRTGATFLEVDPGFFERYLDLAAHPWRHGALEPKVKALVQLSGRRRRDAPVRSRRPPPPRPRARARRERRGDHRDARADGDDGDPRLNVGVPILIEELAAAGTPLDDGPLTAREEEIKADFIAKRGYWNDFWDGILRLDAEFFAAYTAFSAWSWEHGVLEPKVKELIYTAFDSSATHMFEPGLRQHIRNAIAYGATREEIMEVFELASGIGAKSFALGAPALREESPRERGLDRAALMPHTFQRPAERHLDAERRPVDGTARVRRRRRARRVPRALARAAGSTCASARRLPRPLARSREPAPPFGSYDAARGAASARQRSAG